MNQKPQQPQQNPLFGPSANKESKDLLEQINSKHFAHNSNPNLAKNRQSAPIQGTGTNPVVKRDTEAEARQQ